MDQSSASRLRVVGGTGFLLLAIDYLLIPVAFALSSPDLGASNREIAHHFLSHPRTALLPVTGLSSLGAVLYVPAIVGLHAELEHHARVTVILASLLALTMVPLILVQNVFSISIMGLSSDYLAAEPTLSAGMLTAATTMVVAYFKIEFFIVVLFATATLLFGLAMRHARWSPALVATVVTAAAMNLVAQAVVITMGHTHPAGAGAAFLGLLLNIAWFVGVGVRLLRGAEGP